MADDIARLTSALDGRYAISRELGRGGMAMVYLAEDLRHRRQVALKVMHPGLATALGSERFLREIEIAAGLTHPHILPLHDSGAAAGVLYYVMPYLAGESLRQCLERETRLPVDQALQIASEVADALSYAHESGVVHRDIKPENILLHSGHAYVADFGIARAVDAAASDRLTGTGIAIGTPAYMSPEQATGAASIDGRADQYALGCVLYEMLAGEPPFRGPTVQAVLARHSVDAAPPVRSVRPEVSKSVEAAVARALAKTPSDRFPTTGEFRLALAGGLMAPPRRWFAPVGVAAAAVLAAVLVFGVFSARRAAPALDLNLVAVAPFEVLDPSLALWREGLMDVMSANLDGAGPLRTVPPTTVVRRWRGRPDPASAAGLGRVTGAGLALFGRLFSAGRDSVRLAATLLDVGTDRPVAEFALREDAARVDRVADSLTVRVLNELSHVRSLGAVRSSSLGSASPAAVKAYLQGDQFYRRANPDSAIVYYQRAVTLDTTFALAHRKLGTSLFRRDLREDSTTWGHQLRAGAMARGLPPRDSLLVVADSLLAAIALGAETWERSERYLNTTQLAVSRYPDDPEAWHEYGRAIGNVGMRFYRSWGQAIDAQKRAIALDSTFTPAYLAVVAVAALAGDAATVRRYATAFDAVAHTGTQRDAMRLVARLADEQQRRLPSTQRLLNSASSVVLAQVEHRLLFLADTDETSIRLEQRLADARLQAAFNAGDSATTRSRIARVLALRGRVRQAYALGGARDPLLASELAHLGVLPLDGAGAMFDGWLRDGSPLVVLAIPWWEERRDTNKLREVVRRAGAASGWRRRAVYGAPGWLVGGIAEAHLNLARGDSAAALEAFSSLPDSARMCDLCYRSRLTYARLLGGAGRLREAARQLTPSLMNDWVAQPSSGLWVLERARVNERLGRRAEATRAYGYVADLWIHADHELQPFVAESRAALRRLRAT